MPRRPTVDEPEGAGSTTSLLPKYHHSVWDTSENQFGSWWINSRKQIYRAHKNFIEQKTVLTLRNVLTFASDNHLSLYLSDQLVKGDIDNPITAAAIATPVDASLFVFPAATPVSPSAPAATPASAPAAASSSETPPIAPLAVTAAAPSHYRNPYLDHGADSRNYSVMRETIDEYDDKLCEVIIAGVAALLVIAGRRP